MEERQYASLTVPPEYHEHWFQYMQHNQALQAAQYHQMAGFPQYTGGPSEDRVMTEMMVHQEHAVPQEPPVPVQAPAKGKRGRPPNKEKGDESPAKAKRKLDRFNGMSVEEVMAKTLPDVLAHNLDILIIGINPGLLSAYKGHHYPNPGNHFWKCLFLSGITEEQLNYVHDQTLPEKYSIGFTNMVERTTPGSKDLTSKEFREGSRLLVEKLQAYRPLIAVFNGKCIYEIFSKEIFGVKSKNLEFGLQPHKIPDTETVCYLMPSSSPRCAQFPRAQDKVHFFIKLKELRDQLKGVAPNPEVQETKYSFDLDMAKEDAKRLAIKEEQQDPGYEAAFGGAVEPLAGPGQSNGHCDFPYQGTPSRQSEMVGRERAPPVAVDRVLDGQWMMQSFADQIPEIAGGSAQLQ
ncbi:hypothetical protein MATL_G00259050 [Megalops atlanticus]|uniref:G/T mismatch-specific thymine DNA glycosylase n=1 Tax=Megalops atlanticus TaxID=7932 RepID=A0A9D3PAT9_MEGAT|nr:hypothetical protein MATL_G00259050 [Megalops atlanticus]